MKKNLKKLLSLLLTVCMVMSMLTMAVSAAPGYTADALGQVENVGGTNYYKADGTTGSESNYAVALSKTIEAVSGKENLFDITLDVKTGLEPSKNITTTTTTEVKKTHNAAVVLTIDLSGTMARNYMSDGDTYIKAAKDAAIKFIADYVTSAGGEANAQRMIAVVGFDTDARVICGWTNVNTTTGRSAVESKINALKVNDDACKYGKYKCDHCCTNFDGGLILTRNLLKQSAVSSIPKSNSWSIILSDGAPTVTVNSDVTDTTVTEIKSSFWGNQKNNAGTVYQGDYEGGGWTHPAEVEDNLTYLQGIAAEANVNIIGVGGLMDFKLFYDAVYGTSNGTRTADVKKKSGAFTGITPTIGTVSKTESQNMSTGDWMTALATHSTIGGKYYSAENSLDTAFNAITSAIRTKVDTETNSTTTTITSTAWNAADPIDAKSTTPYVEFLGFYSDSAGYKAGATSIAQNPDGDKAELKKGIIDWDLKESNYTTQTVGEKTIYTYSLKYRVRLMNEDEGFVANNPYVTNGPTTFSWQVVTNNAFGDTITKDFPIPAVEGYLAELSFTKVNEENQALSGAEFSLTHADDCGCGIANVDANIVYLNDKNADGTANPGYHEFTKIPSGHKYTLTETKVPDYHTGSATKTVTVSYDTVTTDLDRDDSGFYVVKNTRIPPTSTTWTPGAIKTLTGADLTEGQFSFQLKDATGAVLQTKTNAANGTVAFDAITYTAAGEYTYTISEVAGTTQYMTYDDTVYTVTVTVTEANNALTAVADVAAADITFTNTFDPPPAAATWTPGANKTLTGADLTEGQFTFQLKDASGAVLQTKTNAADGTVAFDAITYTAAGEYTYTISEVAGNDVTITYDSTVYTVTVTVTEADNALTAVADTPAADIIFTNVYEEPETYSLTVVKALSGNATNDGDVFDIVVTLTDASGAPVSGTFSGVEFVNGVATIQFTGAGNKTIELPEGTTYVVTEPDSKGYDASYENCTGTLAEDVKTATAKVTNTKNVVIPDTYELTVEKIFDIFEPGRPDDIFEINITLTDSENQPISGTFSNVKFVDGKASIQLKADQKKVIAGLPEGTRYNVTETDYSDYDVAYENCTGTLNRDRTATVINALDVPTTGSLRIAKTLSGNDTDPRKEFTFTVTLTDSEGEPLSGSFGSDSNPVIFDADGQYTFKMKGGYSTSICALPGGATYTVVESDNEGYTVEVFTDADGDGNNVIEVGEQEYIRFNNHKDKIVIDEDTPAYWTPKAEKTVDGGKANVAGYTFEITGSDGYTETATSDENGNVTFSRITFNSTGMYDYTIREVAGDDESIVYDDSVYNVTVSVTGGLNKTVTVEKNGEAVEENSIDFNNTTVVVEIPEEDPPLGGGEEEEIIEEEDIPLAEVPVTGDISALWAAVAATSGLGLAGLNFLPKKRKDDEED